MWEITEITEKRTVKKTVEVNVYDFKGVPGKVSPYGVYDIGMNKGWVSVGISNDTAEFAVNSVRAWWYDMGESLYENSEKIFITADSGGSNGYRVRLWKTELSVKIHVSHFPPGTSKWNKIEHRMFSFISQNRRGKPLIDYVTIISLISNIETDKGLKIKAVLDETVYEKGKKFRIINLTALIFTGINFTGNGIIKFLRNDRIIFLAGTKIGTHVFSSDD